MTPKTALRFVLPALLLTAVASANAQVVTVTSPGTTTNNTNTNQSDPFAVDTWLRDNVRDGSTVGINSTYARSGNGSAFMQGTIANTSKADMEYYFGGQYVSPFQLSSLAALSYDYYRASSSSASAHYAPSLRLMIDEDGVLGGTDQSVLVFEPIYNGTNVVSLDQWVSNIITGSTNLWWRQFNPGSTVEDPFGQQLSAYMSVTGVTSNNRTISGNSVVYGLSSGIGSGWDGSYVGAVDNIHIGYGNTDVTFNFETQAVATPEPASIVLFATGFIGIAGFARRRRKNA